MLQVLARLLGLSWFVVGCLLVLPARAEVRKPAPADKTLSPYFLVETGDSSAESFPLEATDVKVLVSNVIAEVTVTQTYRNSGRTPINAKYVFPASTRAAVHGLSMTIRDQVIEAQIQEKKAAEKTFEQAKRAGKQATLLEEQRPNVFTMSVANVMPGDRLEIRLRYSELLLPNEGQYEFVYPTVVGPRYSNQPEAKAKPSSRFVKAPYLPEGRPPSSAFRLSATLSSGIPFQSVLSPSHALHQVQKNPGLFELTVDDSKQPANDRDFVLRYRLSGDQIASGLSLFDAGAEKFFLLAVEPPAKVPPAQILPREYLFVVDVSGSMYGFPLDTTKQLMRDLLSKLRPNDKFNLLLFSGDSRLFAPQSMPASEANVAAAIAVLGQERGGGGTELLPALQRALALPAQRGTSRSVIVVTDGFVEADKKTMDYVRAHLGQASVFAFGIGSSVNRYLIEGLARAGMGEPFVVTEPAEAAPVAQRFIDYVQAPVLSDIRVAYQGFDAYDVEPRAVPDVLARRPIVVFGKWRGKPQGSVTLTGVAAGGAYSRRFELAQVEARPEDRALEKLWARTRISALSDFGFGQPEEKVKRDVTALGLRYSLLTQFTSFVAVSRVVSNPASPARDVSQPLPLPRGVSQSAVASELETAFEPELGLLLLLLAGGFGASRLLRLRGLGWLA